MSRAGARSPLINHVLQGLVVAVCAVAIAVILAMVGPNWLGLRGRVPLTVLSLSIAAVFVLRCWPAQWFTSTDGGELKQHLPRMHKAVDHLAAIVVGAYLRSMLSAVLVIAADVDCAATKTGGTLGCRILSHL